MPGRTPAPTTLGFSGTSLARRLYSPRTSANVTQTKYAQKPLPAAQGESSTMSLRKTVRQRLWCVKSRI